jgi:hypothetical protein
MKGWLSIHMLHPTVKRAIDGFMITNAAYTGCSVDIVKSLDLKYF